MIYVKGPAKIQGEINIQGAKNSILPLLAASIICKNKTVLHNCPYISDVDTAVKILTHLGCSCKREGKSLEIDTADMKNFDIPHDLMREMRSSIVFLGSIISRFKEAYLSFPGGCEIGARPIDLHLSALEKMGVKIEQSHGVIHCESKDGVKGSSITLSFPSVGATENIILCAAVSQGTTVIENAAREPEILELANFLNKCGAKVRGAGESRIEIEGAKEIYGCEHEIMPDRIVAATYMASAAVTGGELLLKNCPNKSLMSTLSLFEEAGCRIIKDADRMYLCAPKKLEAVKYVRTMPYPGFPTDAQAPIMAMAVLGQGTSVFVENIFENRYKHALELKRMGAKINIEGKVAVVEGVESLWGVPVDARELRGGASLIVAALAAQGETSITGVEYIDRGYEDIVGVLKSLGADIYRK